MTRGSRTERATLYDVAKAAGVSFKTVSRVLNRENRVSPQTRERVLAAVSELDYTPDMSARSLAGGRSYLLGLLLDVDSIASPYIGSVQSGLTARCREQGYHLLVEPLDLSARDKSYASLKELLANLRLDGVILTPPVCDHPMVLDFLDEKQALYVRIAPDRFPGRAACVHMDEEAAAYELATHLIELGHCDIGFIGGPPDHGASRRRLSGFTAALRAHAVELRPDLVQPGNFHFRSGFEAADRLLKGRPPTAIFASNDTMALGVMACAARRRLNVPGELSVAGFDDIPMSSTIWPSLTTVRQPVGDMAALAAELIIGRRLTDAAGAPMARYVDYTVMPRGSTGPIQVRRMAAGSAREL